MKKVIRTVALFAVLSMVAVGCQKETITDWQANMVMPSETHNVVYTVDGTTYTASFSSEVEWLAFLDRLFALAEEGRSVSFRNAESPVNTKQNREIVTYTTRDKADAENWADVMQKGGYRVRIDFDEHTGIYTCTAVR